ncbi:hypothetical protein SASPL_123857 [Salvia splendens]|uniref:Retrovirus-related Pol polyprotein from transposon TNT 1-94 n=1 Tax=Salvia splendens TaxID=180675 RepID=A0A8X8ZTE1_SALSN|nr:hypothetical protein SASPL_123857 [Salvia splendens]
MLFMSDDVIIEVADQDTAAALWTKLESLYMTKSLTNKLLLKQRLFRLRMQEGMPLRDHLENLNKILLDLRNVDVKAEDDDVALILLVYLPESYENFVESFMTCKETLSLEDVRSALHIREDRQQAMSSATENLASGYLLRVKDRRNSDRRSGTPKIKKKLGKKEDDNGSATVAEADDANSEEELALVADEQPHCNDVWILDSGASFKGEGGVMRILKGSKVVMTSLKWGTLYALRGSIVADSADIASSEVATKDMTKLWHMMIGHMGEQDLEGVDKQMELQVTHNESESQLQGGEDQHTTAEATDTTSSDVHPQARQTSIAIDRARRTGVKPPLRYGFEDMMAYTAGCQ